MGQLLDHHLTLTMKLELVELLVMVTSWCVSCHGSALPPTVFLSWHVSIQTVSSCNFRQPSHILIWNDACDSTLAASKHCWDRRFRGNLQLPGCGEYETRNGAKGCGKGCHLKNREEVSGLCGSCFCHQQEGRTCRGLPWLDVSVLCENPRNGRHRDFYCRALRGRMYALASHAIVCISS